MQLSNPFIYCSTMILLLFTNHCQSLSQNNHDTQNRSFLNNFLRFRHTAQGVSSGCSSVLESLQTNTRSEEWAFKIMDANAVPESGLADGNIQFLGSFDQCLEQKVSPNSYVGDVQNSAVQYCTVNFPISMILNGNETQVYPKFLLQMIPPQAGICLPALCTSKHDLPAIFSSFTEHTNQSLILTNCVTKDDLSLKNRFHLRHIIILAIYLFIIALGSADSLLPESSSPLRQAIGCFGLVKNFKSLFKQPIVRKKSLSSIPFVRNPSIIFANAQREYSPNLSNSQSSFSSSESPTAPIGYSVQVIEQQPQKNRPKLREIECLHGIRFISFYFILLYHTFTGAQTPSVNLLSLMRAELSFLKQLITNAGLWVDTFFLIGGFLTCHTSISRANPSETVLKYFLDHPKRILHRFIRLTPSIAGVISLSILVEALGSGPIWYQYTSLSESTCHKNWFLPLIYLNNLINLNQLYKAPSECLSYLWYLGVDMQFFVISPILVSFLASGHKKYQKIGVAINLFTMLSSFVYTFWTISKDNLTPTVLVSVYDLSYINNVYKSPLCRIGSYCVGILFAYYLHSSVFTETIRTKVIHDDDDEYEHNSSLYGAALFVGGLSLIFAVTLLTYPWLHQGSYANFYSALYGSIHRTVWAFGWSLVIYVCVTKSLPKLNDFLSYNIFRFLSKLTYQNYLVHDIIISAVLFSTRQKVYFSDFNLIGETILYFAITTVVSVAAYIMFEKPAINLQIAFLK